MCEPTTWIAIGVAVLGGAVSYQNSKNAQRYTEKVADQNKKVVEAQALDAERLGQREASERRLKTRLQMATQTAGFGAQNVEQTGTALDILGDTAMFGQIDEDSIRANAQRKAWGYRQQGWNIEADKRLAQFKGKADRTGIILTTASSVAGAWGGAGASASSGMTSAQAGSYGQASGFSGLGSLGY